MAISSDVIRNRLDKKINYGVARTAYDSVKDPGAETIGSPMVHPGNSMLLDDDLIPAVMPAVNTAEVKVHKYNSGKSVGNNVNEVGGLYELTKDTGVVTNRSWITCATVGTISTIEKSWLPFGLYGSSYFNLFVIANKGYHFQNIDPSTMTNYEALNYATNNYEFYFDADAGVFVFAGTSGLPGSFNPSTMAVYMTAGARYIGRLGLKNYIDVVIANPAAGEVIKYDTGTSKWTNQTAGGGTLASMTDTNIPSPTNEQVLKYDTTSSKWIAGSGGGGTLDSLTDTALTTLANDNVLQYNGTAWVNANVGLSATTVSEDVFDGTTTPATNGTQVIFDTTEDVQTESNLLVTVDGIVQPNTAWILSNDGSGNPRRVTLSSAPLTGQTLRLLNISVSSTVAYVPSTGSVTSSMLSSQLKEYAEDNFTTVNASTVNFDCATDLLSETSIIVTIDGVTQPSTAFSLSTVGGNQRRVVLSAAPETGANVRVLNLGMTNSAGPLSAGVVNATHLANELKSFNTLIDTGDGTTVNYDMSQDILTHGRDLLVTVDGIVQTETTHYTIGNDGSGNQRRVIFGTAPITGTAIRIMHLGVATSTSVYELVNDVTPQLGGQLDVNSHGLGDGTNELLKFTETGSAVNEFTITNAATGSGPNLSATGDDTNIDINITPKGTGEVILASDATVTGSLTVTGTTTFNGGTITLGDALTDTITFGGTITGNLVFEGTTDDVHELTVSPGNPTADRTVIFPDADGTLLIDLLADTTPQLGGDLDLNNKNITGTGGIPAANLTGTIADARMPNLTGDITTVEGNVATTIAVDAVDIAMLSATGTASSSTFLRGDNSWQTAGSTSASDLDSGTLLDARMPNLTGDVTTVEGAVDTTIATGAVDIAMLSATGTASSTTFLRGDNSWTTVTTDLVADITPQLGANLDVNGKSIVSLSNGDIAITPHGTGKVVIASDVNFTSNASIKVPTGTTGQQGTAIQGAFRFNTTDTSFEGYDGSAWGAIGGAENAYAKETFTGSQGTVNRTTFTLANKYTLGYIDVYLNGVKLVSGSGNDFIASSTSAPYTVVLATGAATDDVIQTLAFNTFVVAENTLTTETFTATASQTTFTLVDPYTVGNVQVYLNGVKLLIGVDVTATNGTTIVLTDPADVDDAVQTVAYGSFASSDHYLKSETYTKTETYTQTEVDTNHYTKTEHLALPSNILPDTHNTRDLGSSAVRWANVYAADVHLKNERGDWSMVEEEDYLTVINNKTGKRFKLLMEELD